LGTAVGRTHASSVIPVVRCNDAASGTDTTDDDPSNDNADPNFPDADHVAPLTDPLLPPPDESPTDVPDPSLNENAATNPDVAGWPLAGSRRQTSRNAAAVTRGHVLAGNRLRSP